MRSTRPKPLHLLCGRAMVLLRARLAGRLRDRPGRRRRRPRRRAGHQEAPGRRARPASSSSSSSTCQRGTGDAVERRPHRPSPTTTLDDADGRRARAPRRHAAAAGRRPSPRWSPSTAQPARRAPSSPPASPTPPATAASCGARTTGSPASSSRPTPPTRSSAIDEINTAIYCFRRSVLGPGAAPAQPRQRPGRVLPDRRRRGAARRRLPGRRRRRPTTPTRPRASTTALQLAAAEAELRRRTNERWLRAGRHHGRPRPHLHRRHRRARRPTSPCSPAPSSRAARVVGGRRRDRAGHPAGRLRRRRRRRGRADGRPRRRDRGRRPRRARSPCSSPAASRPRRARSPGRSTLPSGPDDAVARRDRDRPTRVSDRDLMELVTKKRLHLVVGPMRTPTLAEEIADHLGVELGEPNLRRVRQRRDALPLRRVRPRRRRLHHPDPRRPTAVGERRDHGAADHDRRRQAGLGQAHHRRVPVLRLRPPGPQGRGPRADHRQARRRHVHGRRRRPRDLGRPALRPDPGLLRRAGRPPHRHAGARRLHPDAGSATTSCRVARRRPGEGGRALRQPRSTPTWPSSTSAGSRAWTNAVEARDVIGDVDGRHCVLIDDMIDTAGTIVRRRRAAQGAGRHRGLGHGHPRRAVRTRPSTGSRTR